MGSRSRSQSLASQNVSSRTQSDNSPRTPVDVTTMCGSCRSEVAAGMILPFCCRCRQFFHSRCVGYQADRAFAILPVIIKSNWRCESCLTVGIFGTQSSTGKRGAAALDSSTEGDAGDASPVRSTSKRMQVDTIETELGEVPGDDASTKEQFRFLCKAISNIHEMILHDRTENRQFINGVKEEFHHHQRIIDTLAQENETLKAEMYAMKEDRRLANAYSRRNNLIVHGVPKLSDAEEARKAVLKVAKAAGYELQASDIDACHDLPAKKGPPKLICKFVSRWKKEKLQEAIKKKKNLKAGDCDAQWPDPEKEIFATEHLDGETTELVMYAKRRLWKRNAGRYEYVWAKNGRVWIKLEHGATAIEIRSTEQIDNLAC